MRGKAGGVPMRLLWAATGKPALPRGHFLCYRDDAKPAYLVIERATDDPSFSRGVSISAAPNCFGKKINQASGFENWKTEKGIGIGSTLPELLRAYGHPSSVDTDPRDWTVYFPGGRRAKSTRKIMADRRIYIYQPQPGPADLSEAEIGVAHGRVAWISLYRDE